MSWPGSTAPSLPGSTTCCGGVGIEPDLVISGGIGKNIGVVHKIEERVGLKALLPEEPQIVGALGAALFARDRTI